MPTPPSRRFATWQDHADHVRRLAESLGLRFEPRPQPPYGWHLCAADDQELLYGSLGEIESHLGHEILWDPKEIGHDVWRRVGIDPATLTSDIAGSRRVYGFKRCGGIEDGRAYAVSVWSQLYTVDDVRRKETGVEFVPVIIGDRTGFRYSPSSDRHGDRCELIFLAADASYSIEVLRLDPRTRIVPADRALEVARVIVPLLPSAGRTISS
jgi:hypothetical protein